jgi:cell wall-associated NlpC family hydrolase
MIEQRRSSVLFSERHDSDLLQRRANRQRQRYQQQTQALQQAHQWLIRSLASPRQLARKLPTRFLLHAVIVLVMPLAVLLSSLHTQVQAPSVAQPLPASPDLPLGLGPVLLDDAGHASMGAEGAMPIIAEGDAPLSEDDGFPVPLSITSRSEALAPLVVPATVAGDVVKLRTGPGLDYDDVARLTMGTPVEVIGRRGDWFQVREGATKPVYWMSGELLNIPEAAVYTLFEVQDKDIPPPPPARVAVVREEGLNLRDGPGTNYVGMTKLAPGAQLALVEQYQDWLHVIAGDNEGWVKAEFLNIADGVLPRVQVTNTIPEANPAMVGTINDSGVNLRKGPASEYAKVGNIGTGTQVSLLGKYKDWYKIETAKGTVAWVFGDLLNIGPMARRRVATTKDFPALPKPAVAARARGASSGRAISVPASGDAASFAVQFVGYRYRWGGASPAGFDCSGLMNYVYAKLGVRLPRSAAAQFSTAYGARVSSMSSLAPGDLVFFVGTGGRRGISHVAMYIGGGRIVHAMTPSRGVQVSNVWDGYWVSHFYGGLRPYR